MHTAAQNVCLLLTQNTNKMTTYRKHSNWKENMLTTIWPQLSVF